MRCYNGVTHDEIVEAAKERFDYDKRASIPNLLSKQFAVNINFDYGMYAYKVKYRRM